MKSRIFNITQYEVNPKTGVSLNFNEDNIKKCVSHKTIKQYAYICHDKDTYTEEEYKKARKNCTCPNFNIGSLKPAHWHIVLRCNDATEVSVIAKWLGIPDNQVDVPKGHGAFLDCVQYLSHEDEKQQEQGKHLYSDEEIRANFDFRKELKEREAKRLKYGKDLDKGEQIFYDVCFNGKTIREVIDEDELFYIENYKKIEGYRMDYLKRADPPKTRINYYITGSGGAGKDLISRALARSLYPQLQNDDDIFFIVGAENSTFEGYDGQPIIIWSDFRAVDLINTLGGRGNVFRVFDSHPSKQRQNVKYGSTNLINTVNIVNSVQPYEEFLNGLAGEYTDRKGNSFKSEDKKQSFRRFPFIIPLYEQDFALLINKGFMNNDGNFLEYEEYTRIRGNIKAIRERCRNNERIAKQLETQSLKPITDKHNEVLALENSTPTDEELLEEFKDYGKMIPVKEHNSIDTMTEEEHQKIIELFYKSNSRTGLMEIVKNEYKFLEDKTINAMSIDELKQLVEANLPF